MSTTRRTPGIYLSPAPRGANGEKLCRNCHGPMPKGRNYHNCSPACSEAWRARTSPSYMRLLVFKRDKGVCAKCGKDVFEGATHRNGSPVTRRARGSGHLWEADHILPVVEGGGECTLENFRTLCIPCHKQETADLARRRAHDRHVKKPLPLFDQVGA